MDHHFNSIFNQNKERQKRPQTPGDQHQHYRPQPNKSYNHLPQFSPSQHPMPQYHNYHKGLTKSRASVSSSNSQL